jgi:hypothetical protein
MTYLSSPASRLSGFPLAALCLSIVCLAILGCGVNLPSTGPIAGGHLHGNLSEQQSQHPISGATIRLYAAGTSGYASNATSLLTPAVVSDVNGNFSITGDYTCPSATSQLYLVATGGNPGLASGTNNTAVALMAALGPCSLHGSSYTLDPNSFVSVNEVTTVASVYALAAFMDGSAAHVGTSSTNATGLANSFELVNNMVNTGNGMALSVTSAGNGTVPQATINTLADILAPCINSDGTGAPCSALFAAATPNGGTAPTDTIQAIYNIARHPANNVSTLYGLASAGFPFGPTLPAAPNDWTLGLSYTTVTLDSRGGGASQSALAIDGAGDIWIANQFTTSDNTASSVSELSNNGTILSGAAGYTGGGINRPNNIAIDPSGDAWVVNLLSSSLSKFSSGGMPLSGSGFGAPSCFSSGLAIDGSGDVWCGRLTKFDSGGDLLGSFTGGGVGLGDNVQSIAIDPTENVWLAAGTGNFTSTVAKFTSAGAPLSGSTGYTNSGLSAAWAIANDSAGDTWVTNNTYPSSSVYKFANDGTILSPASGYTGGGLSNPLGVAIDGAGNAWVTSDHIEVIGGVSTVVSSLVELNNSGTIVSGATGYNLPAIGYPLGDAVDGSGDVWTVFGESYVVETVGVATPVVTPLSLGLKNGTLGVRP